MNRYRSLPWIATLVAALLGAPFQACADVPASERAALIGLYTSTTGSGWSNRAHWNTSDPICPGTVANNWYGVYCDASNSYVKQVILDANNLNGTLPSLSGLAKLDYFSVGGNQLTGAVPALASLTSLTYFNVGKNQLTGAIPALAGLTNLSGFYANDNQLTGSIPALAGLTQLSNLEVSNNQLTGTIPSLNGLTLLSAVGVANNQLTGTLPANAFTTTGSSILFVVRIDGNAFAGPIPTAPASLQPVALLSRVCPNAFDAAAGSANDTAWNNATGVTPWSTNCNGTTTSVSANPSPAAVGQAVTFTTHVSTSSTPSPTGSVAIAAGTQSCSASLSPVNTTQSSGSCVLTFASAGTVAVAARYVGDGSHAQSTGSTSVSINGSVTPPTSPPVMAAVFSPAAIVVGSTSTLSIAISNPASNTAPLTGVGFTNSLPAGLTVVNSSTPMCGGTLTTTAPNGVGLTAATIAAQGQCQFSLVVTGASAGNYSPNLGPVSAIESSGSGNDVSVSLNVTPAAANSSTTATATALDRFGLLALMLALGLLAARSRQIWMR